MLHITDIVFYINFQHIGVNMKNDLKKKVKDGKAYNVAYNEKTKEGYYILRYVNPKLDYVDTIEEVKISSIWKDPSTSLFFALTYEQEQNKKFPF